MNRILNVRSAIYTQFHGSSAFSVISQRGDDFAAYYTSMYLMQDTGELKRKIKKAGAIAKMIDSDVSARAEVSAFFLICFS